MTQKTAFSLSDGLATPVARNFALLTRNNNDLVYQRADGSTVRALRPLLKINQSVASAARPTDKTGIEVIVPFYKVVDGVDTFQKVARVSVNFVVDSSIPESFIADLFAYARAALNDVDVQNTVVKRNMLT